MKPMRHQGWALAVLATLAAPGHETSAQMFVTTGKDTLRSLPGVELIVEPLQPELESRGVTAAALRADVSRRLRAAGVPLFANQRANTSEAKPYLFIHLNAVETPRRDLFAIAIQVQVRQTVRSLSTGSAIVDAITWDSHSVVLIRAKELQRAQESVAEHVERFLVDWAAVQ